MATRKPTYGTGPDDIDIQATKAVRKPRTDVVDAKGKPIRELTRAEKDAQYKKIKTKYETARATVKAKIAASPRVVKSRPEGSATPKPATKTMAKAKPKITKVEKQIAAELSPKGMKKAAKDQAKALDKKYPGLYKKKAN
jgi:hypothetical protein